MARSARLPIIVAVSLAIAATGVCSSLSAGAESSCAAAPAPECDSSCAGDSPRDACPETPERPSCRTCDGTVAFLLKEKMPGGDAPSASLAHVFTRAPRPAAAIARATTSLHLSSISSSPPPHILNVTFRN